MRDGKRLFVGARVSVATANALAGCAETLARRARDAGLEAQLKWVPPINYHVTLKFLGWTGLDAIGAVADALARAVDGFERLTFRASRLGGFPALEKANVLWAGIEDGAALGKLAQAIDRAMTGLGYSAEPRPYHPHVTLARLREARAIREVVLPMAEQMFGDTRIDSVTLFESETKSSGSVYRDLERIDFKTAQNKVPAPEKRQTPALELATPEREPEETDDGWPRGQGPND